MTNRTDSTQSGWRAQTFDAIGSGLPSCTFVSLVLNALLSLKWPIA
jgi:hypothetical protein